MSIKGNNIKQNNDYILSIDEYNPELTYFEFTSFSNEEMATREDNYDRLVVQCTEDEEFDPSTIYYTYDGEKPAGKAVSRVSITADEFNSNRTGYYNSSNNNHKVYVHTKKFISIFS